MLFCNMYRLYTEVKVAMIFIKLIVVGLRFNKYHTVLRCITDFYHAKPTGISVAPLGIFLSLYQWHGYK